MKRVRVRFAPSPTGHLHIGGVRTALFNYIFAMKHGGDFVLRVEDTDLNRSKNEYTRSILASLDWLGLTPYEGPYFQSERLDLYKKYAEEMVRNGKAYYCYCTKEDIEKQKAVKTSSGGFKYDGKCRENLGKDAELAREAQAIRVVCPESEDVSYNDAIRGMVTVNTREFDDFIIMKSDGTPTYSYACVIDDYLLNISHVIRGEDHVTNTFKQIILYNALGWEVPEFAHIPLINGPDGTRLSKRHGATALIEYKRMGYLKEAIINYLSLLGWNPGDNTEIFDIAYLIEHFDLSKVSKNAARFDMEKLIWFNGEYLFRVEENEKAGLISEFCSEFYGETLDRALLEKIIPILGTRGKTLEEIRSYILFFFRVPDTYDEAVPFEKAAELMMLLESAQFKSTGLEAAARDFALKNGIKLKVLAQFIRLAISGKKVSPGVFESMEILGREETLKRIGKYMNG